MIKHFKLTSGDEIVCEVLDSDEDMVEAVIRKVLKIVIVDDWAENTRYYTLKPWLSFQDDTEELVCLNQMHIIGESQPSDTLMKHYLKALDDVKKYNAIRTSGKVSQEEMNEALNELTESEMEEFLKKKYEELQKNLDPDIHVEISYDSSEMNIIPFKPKGTVH